MRKSSALGALTLLAAVHIAGAAPQYLVTDLGTLSVANTQGTHALAINSKGQITGDSDLDGTKSRAFLYSNGTMTDLGSLGGAYSQGTAINDAGVVVGIASSLNSIAPQGFIAVNGFIAATGGLGGGVSFAQGINNAGQITGSGETTTASVYHAFIREKSGTFSDFSTAFFGGGSQSYATAINQAGHIVGSADTANNTYQHAFFIFGLGVDLTPNLAANSTAFALNNATPTPVIVGSTGTQDTAGERAALFPGSAATALGELAVNGLSRALAVNDAGTIVGFAATGSGNHAFIFRNQDASPSMVDLNSLIAPGGTVTLTSATGINASGQICATGRDTALTPNYDRAFLLTPLITPTVKISGPKSLKTKKPTLLVRGTATGTVASVSYTVGKTAGKASGTTAWKFTAKLKKGKNVISVLAKGAAGSSTPAKITVTRK